MRFLTLLLALVCSFNAAAETCLLKASTAVTIKLGPFVDSTDGFTAKTGLDIDQADVRVSKNGGDFAQKNDTGANAAHDELGFYDIALNATDTNTAGRLLLAVTESGAAPVWKECQVVGAAEYDYLAGTNLRVVPGRTTVWPIPHATTPTYQIPVRLQSTLGTGALTTIANTDTALRIQAIDDKGNIVTYVGNSTVQAVTDSTPPGNYEAPSAGNVRWELYGGSGALLYEMHLEAAILDNTDTNFVYVTIYDTTTPARWYPETVVIDQRVGNAADMTTVMNAVITSRDVATNAVVAAVNSRALDIQNRLPSALTDDGNIKADTLRVGGTTQTARDLGASVLLSPGTGTGQISLASGAVSANVTAMASDVKEAIVDELLGSMIGPRTLECVLQAIESYAFGEWARVSNVVTYRSPEGEGIEVEVTLAGDNLSRPDVSITCP